VIPSEERENRRERRRWPTVVNGGGVAWSPAVLPINREERVKTQIKLTEMIEGRGETHTRG